MLRATFWGLMAFFGAMSLVLPIAAKEPVVDKHSWERYDNARFRYSICYPQDVLTPEREADNSDGRRFTGRDGASLAVWGSNNALSSTLKQMADETVQRLTGSIGRVTYRTARANWVVISGETASGVFYDKIFYDRKADQFKQFEMTYDRSQASLYNTIVSKIAGCFVEIP